MRREERGLSRAASVAIVVAIVVAIIPVTVVVILLTGGPQDFGDFKVAYGTVTNPAYAQLEQTFKQYRMFETIADGLNDVLALPRDITIVLAEVGVVNAWWDPSTSQIVLTYELMEHFGQIFAPHAQSEEELGQAVLYATVFVFSHEMGHALVSVHNLPITGKEEDAVDQLATLIFIESDSAEVAFTAANWFYLAGQQAGTQNLPFWGVHSLDMQRYYNIIAWIYGSNPQKYSYIVTGGYLPEGRAQTAQYEYQQMSNSWNKLLSPYQK
jgi:hypothetical protein